MAKPPPRRVREPIQVYLTAEERSVLEHLAKTEGVSRAEVLRRGLVALAQERQSGRSPMLEFARWVGQKAPAIPSDVAQRHDEYLGRTIREEW